MFVNHAPYYQCDAEFERERQAIAAARLVEERRARRELHVVLAGDFNAEPGASSVRFWTGCQSLGGMSVCYRDVWESAHPADPAHTFAPRNPLVAENKPNLDLGRRFDDVLARCVDHGPTLAVAACALAFDEPVAGVWASDHFGLVADLAAPTRNPATLP